MTNNKHEIKAPEVGGRGIYDRLLDLPPFRGATVDSLSKIVGTTKFHFLKYPAGTLVLRRDAPCDHLTMLISGSVDIRLTSNDGRFEISQTLTGPDVVMPDFLFGRERVFPADVKALTTVSVLQIQKNDFLTILTADNVYLLNYLNYITTSSQHALEGVLALTGGSVVTRLAYWITTLTQKSAVDITVRCRPRDLSSALGVQRSVFNSALAELSEKGIVEARADCLRIVDRRKLERLLTE